MVIYPAISLIGPWGSGSPSPWGGFSGGSIPPGPKKLQDRPGSTPGSPTTIR